MKPAFRPVGFWILQVDFFVGDVHVSTDDYRLGFFQFFQVRAEHVIPEHPVIQTLQLIFGVGGIHIDQKEIVIFRRDDTAFLVMFLNAKPKADAKRLFLGKKSRCRSILFFRRSASIGGSLL